MEFADKKVIVFGGGKSGIASIQLLQKLGARVTFLDGNKDFDKESLLIKCEKPEELEIVLGDLPEVRYGDFDAIVMSPGVPSNLPVVDAVVAAGAKLLGEIELGYLVGKGRVCAITGTNGKTTTTTLVGEILKAAYQDVRVVGNIGIPYTSECLGTTEDTVYAAEISSFQLETTDEFHPVVSAILNITPDHLNRHGTMEEYIRLKEKVTYRQNPDEVCVLNYEDEVLRQFGENCPCKAVFFSSKRKLEDGFYYEDGTIYKACHGEVAPVINVNELTILGLHNYENVMAAVACTEAMGVSLDVIRPVLKSFKAVEHRIEYTCTKRGVDFFNDSKATNTDAAIQGIRAMIKPTHLIGGGYDKHCSFIPWLSEFNGKVKTLVLIGQTRDQIKTEAESLGITNIVFAESLNEAIDICYSNASEGEAVLLSPACASWGMFDNYEQRGRMFKEYARSLSE